MEFHPLLNPTALGIFALPVVFYFLLKHLTSVKGVPPEAGGAWPLIGHIRLLSGPELPHVALGALADKYGSMFSIRLGIHRFLVVSSADIAKDVFKSHDVSISTRPDLTVGRLLGYDNTSFGFSPYNSYWREIRKFTVSELLSPRRLNLLKPVKAAELECSVKELYGLWKATEKSETGYVMVDINNWVRELNLNLMLRLIAGKRCSGDKRVRATVREFFRVSSLLTAGDLLPFLRWLDIGGHEREMKKAAKEMDQLVEEWVEEHKRKRDTTGNEDRAGCQDIMDVLLSALEGMDLGGKDVDTVAKATATTLLSGGAETTTVTLTWTLGLLLNHPDTLQKAQQELEQHVGRERVVTESDIDNLVYLQAVIKESLRLHPAASLAVMRVFTEACTVRGYYVPKGTKLLLNLWKIQTDPSIWSVDPLEFNPERFLGRHKDVDVRGQHFELIPFGAGRRACPAITFALQMIHYTMASLLQAFEMARPTAASIDMTSSPGKIANIKDTSLEILIKPRLPSCLHE